MKLKDILKEAEGFGAGSNKKSEPDLDFLKHVQKGLGSTMEPPAKEPEQDLDFLNQVHKGLAKSPPPAAHAADRITNKMYDKNRPEQQKATQSGANQSPPSLSQLAKDVDSDETQQGDQEDDTFKDFPKFNDADSEDWNQNPFGDPDAGQNTDTRTGFQKGASAVGKGLKAAGQKAGQLGKQLGQKAGQVGKQLGQKAAQKASSFFNKGDEVPSNWEPDSEPGKEDDSPMPSMSNVAKQGLTGKHWQWKPGQKVDIGFVKDLEVVKTDQYGAQLKSKNGSMYRFIPHRGLRKIA